MGLLELTNPVTGEVKGILAEYTEAEVQAAMAKAREAFVRWGQTSLAERLAYVRKLRLYLADNTVLLKPSEVTPLTGLLIERAFRAAGLPDGVVQVLHGGRETGQALVAAKPDTIFFTGSVQTGKKIAAAAGALWRLLKNRKPDLSRNRGAT